MGKPRFRVWQIERDEIHGCLAVCRIHLRAVAVHWTLRRWWRRDDRRSRISGSEEKRGRRKGGGRVRKPVPCRFTYFNGASCTLGETCRALSLILDISSFPDRIYISTGPLPVHPWWATEAMINAGLLKRREINGTSLFVLIANADNMMNRRRWFIV